MRSLLDGGGLYLANDHYVGPDGMSNDQLYMTVDEQRDALRQGGFTSIDVVLQKNGLVLHAAR